MKDSEEKVVLLEKGSLQGHHRGPKKWERCKPKIQNREETLSRKSATCVRTEEGRREDYSRGDTSPEKEELLSKLYEMEYSVRKS